LNRKIFHWFGFMLFVYNTIVGLATAVLRVIISTILGLVLMLRLDRVILMKGFELLDIGVLMFDCTCIIFLIM